MVDIKDLEARSDVDGLIAALNNPGSAWGYDVAMALGRLKDPRSIPLLCTALTHADKMVRQCAAFALGEIGDKGAVESLIILLQRDPEGYVRGHAAEALGKIGDKRAMEPVASAASWDKDSGARDMAKKAWELIYQR